MSERPEDNRTMARGAGLAFLGKLGAVIEPVSVIVFANFYGAATLGIFLLLWGYVLITSGMSDLAMTTALQRYVPADNDEDRIHRVLRAALVISLSLSLSLALAVSLAAPWLQQYINAAPEITPHLGTIVALYAWAIPLWCFIDVSTAAVRARRAFGPEVKVRIFYEQGLRLILGVAFFFFGVEHYGLFLAHLFALFVAGLLSLRLLSRYYDLGKLIRVRAPKELYRELVSFGLPMSGNNFLKKSHSNFPIFVLNFMLPGTAGAVAVAVYAVGRKVVSALQVIRQSFEYVMAPLASAKNALTERGGLQDMYAFATRLICTLFIPIGTAVVMLRHDIAALVGPTFEGAGIIIAILAIGRAVEAFTGPSQAVLEMLAKSRIPLFNGLTGFVVTMGLMLVMTPKWGAAGAAIATAIGMNIPSIASLLQVRSFYDLVPYDRQILPPLFASLMGAAIVALVLTLIAESAVPLRFLGGVLALLAAYFLLLRYGFSDRDATAFGRLARWIRH